MWTTTIKDIRGCGYDRDESRTKTMARSVQKRLPWVQQFHQSSVSMDHRRTAPMKTYHTIIRWWLMVSTAVGLTEHLLGHNWPRKTRWPQSFDLSRDGLPHMPEGWLPKLPSSGNLSFSEALNLSEFGIRHGRMLVPQIQPNSHDSFAIGKEI